MTILAYDQPSRCEACKKKSKQIMLLEDIKLCPDCYFKSSDAILQICMSCGNVLFIKTIDYTKIENKDFQLCPAAMLFNGCSDCTA